MLAKVSRFCTKSFCRRNVGSRRTAFLLAHLTHEFEKKRSAQTEHDEAVATGADSLSIDELTGALASIAATQEPQKLEAWATKGQAFFQSKTRKTGKRNQGNNEGAPKGPDSDPAR